MDRAGSQAPKRVGVVDEIFVVDLQFPKASLDFRNPGRGKFLRVALDSAFQTGDQRAARASVLSRVKLQSLLFRLLRAPAHRAAPLRAHGLTILAAGCGRHQYFGEIRDCG
jgi:hypothetical protein